MKKNNIRKNIVFGCFIVIVIILVIIVANIILSRKNKKVDSTYDGDVKIYELKGDSANFSYKDGLFINSNVQNILVNGNVTITNDKLMESDIVNVTFKVDDDITKQQNSFFKGVDKEYVGYNELFKKSDYTDSNFSLLITYTLKDKRVTEVLSLEKVRLLNKSDVPKDLSTISKDNSRADTSYYEEMEKKTLALENKGFKWNGCCFLERTFDNGDTVTFRADGSSLYYVNKQNNYGVTSTMFGNEHTYYDDNYFFTYYTDTNEIKCDEKKKCPSDGYELLKDYLDFFENLWD